MDGKRILRGLVAAGLVVAVGALVSRDAIAFRKVAVGEPAPAATLSDSSGGEVSLPLGDRPSVIVFFRAEQRYSQEAVTDASEIARAIGDRVGVFLVAERGSDPARVKAFAAQYAPAARLLLDPDGAYAEAFGTIVLPSTAIVSPAGLLAGYLPSRSRTFRPVAEGRVRVLLGDESEAAFGARLRELGESGAADERSRKLRNEARALAAQGDLAGAGQVLARALAAQPDDLAAHLQLGFVFLDRDDLERARSQFERAREEKPASPGARLGLAIIEARAGDVDAGIRALEQAVQLNPDPVRGYAELGRIYEARGDHERARKNYRFAVRKLLQGRN